MFRLATRDMRGDQWSNKWPALLDYTIVVPTDAPFFLNNLTIDTRFDNINNIYEFIKLQDTMQTLPDNNMNLLYSIYQMTGETIWEPFYSMRPKLFNESDTHYTNDLGERSVISYVRVDANTIIIDPATPISYSTPMIMLNTSKYISYFEGVFPLTINNKKDSYYKKSYVLPLSEFINTDMTEIKLSTYNSNKKPSWISGFLEKLELIQVELEKISYNKGFFEQSGEYLKLIEQINQLNAIYKTYLSEGKITFPMSQELVDILKEIQAVPVFYDGSIYQLKYNQKIITWHQLYGYMIDINRWVPSQEFFDMVSAINIFTWKQQYPEQIVVFNALEALVKVCEDNLIIEPVYTVGQRVTHF